ncbi:MAG: hypothetical protein KDI28_03280 [Pseudomonadales bacterium]|nr:hypothetical protein [Pseudomonadales bacterium]
MTAVPRQPFTVGVPARRQPRWLALLCVFVVSPAVAQPDAHDQPGLHLPNMDTIRGTGAWSWLENQRDNVSRNVSGVGRYLDDWLAGDGVGEHSNQSYLRLKLNQQVSETGAYYSNVRISGRVDLPRATERWKLIFESEQTDQESIQNQRLSNIRPSEFSGGFSYQLPETDNGFRFTHDIGIKGRIPLDPFYRFKTRYGHDLSETWALGMDHKLWYYHTEGWGQDGRLYFTRSLREDMFLRFDTEAHFRNRHDAVEYAQTVALHRTLGERETLTYEAGVIGNTKPTSGVTSYYAQSVYRKAIHEDWLVMELVPQLVMERNNDWNPDPRIQFNLEVYFFDF